MDGSSDVMAGAEWRLREATGRDLRTILHHRRRMFYDMGFRDEAALDAMEATSASFIKAGLEDGSYRGWLAETTAGVVAGGGAMIVGYPSTPSDPSPRRVWILNMYTEPAYRRQGIANCIIAAIIGWCREQGFGSVSLHASEGGRHLYEVWGFKPTNEMRLPLV